MFIYNVTSKVDHTISAAWLQWMKEEHIPEIIATGCFTKATILQLLETDDSEGPTFAIQYTAESKALYNRYLEKFAPELRQKVMAKWGNKFIAFRSIMQVIE
jgi:Domain of unknown function (DUF4286)